MIAPARLNTLPGAEPPQAPLEPSRPRDGIPTGPGGKLGRDQFLKLLVAQMNNQDPMNPLNGQEMAAQLAQFSTVEQLLQMNEKLDAQAGNDAKIVASIEALAEQQQTSAEDMLAAIESTMALGAVGKVGVMNGDRLFVDEKGGGVATFDAGTRAASAARIRLLDREGRQVAERMIYDVPPGMQSIDLARLDPPLDVPAGEYRFTVDVTDNAAFRAARVFTSGRITGLTATPTGPQLLIGDRLTVPFSRLLQVRS